MKRVLVAIAVIAVLSIGAGLLAGSGAPGGGGRAASGIRTGGHGPHATATPPAARTVAARAAPRPQRPTIKAASHSRQQTAPQSLAAARRSVADLTAVSRPSHAARPATSSAVAVGDPASTGIPAPGPLLLLNPNSVAPGATINVLGSDFDAGKLITLTVGLGAHRLPLFLDTAQAGRDGAFSKNVTLPSTLTAHSFWIVAQERKGPAHAMAQGALAVGSPTATLSTAVGKPGDTVYASARGFDPHEEVGVFLNNLGTAPVVTLQADGSGALSLAPIPVPYGPSGPTSLLLLGQRSRGLAAVPFEMLNLYPTASISRYSAVADTVLRFSAAGFGPHEVVDVRVNTPNGIAIGRLRADQAGVIHSAGRFRIPFTLKGRNTFVLTGEQSHTSTTMDFTVQPYTPIAAPSSYGGGPGTAITFYGAGFARHETVRVWLGGKEGRQVATMSTDGQGNLMARPGLYFISAGQKPGKLLFTLAGDKSVTPVAVSFDVQAAGGPVQLGAGSVSGGQ